MPLAQARLIAIMRGEEMRSVAVTFDLGDTITFRLSPVTGVVQSIDAHVLGVTYSVPLARCGSIKNVRFDTLTVGLGERDERKEGTFTFMFRMGTEKDRRFGELPRVQLNFYKGQFIDPLIYNKTAPRSGYASSLCPGVPIEVPR